MWKIINQEIKKRWEFLGMAGAFGDDPKDYYWVSSGIDYYDFGCYK
jgi:hypothetical protein